MALPTNKAFGPPTEPLMTWLSLLLDRLFYIRTYDVTFNPANIGATTANEQTITVEGLRTTDRTFVNPPALTAGLILVSSRVSADDTLALTFYNTTAGAINEGSGTYNVIAIRK